MAGKRKLTGKQLRGLFARGILRSSGSGKNRRVVYNKNANATSARKFGRKAKSGRARTSNESNPFAKSGRAVIGGSKVSGLRSGGGSGRRVPSKAERDGTRAGRIEAGRNRLMERGILKDLEKIDLFGSVSNPRPSLKGRSDAAADRGRGIARAARARARYINQAGKSRKAAESSPFAATREARVARGREAATRFLLRQAGGVAAQQKATPLKQMASRYPGKFLDSGKPFQAGAKIYYGDGKSGKGAYARQPRFENLRNIRTDGFGGKLTRAQRVATLTLQEGVKAGFKGKKLKDKIFGVTRTRFRQERVLAAKFMEPFSPRK